MEQAPLLGVGSGTCLHNGRVSWWPDWPVSSTEGICGADVRGCTWSTGWVGAQRENNGLWLGWGKREGFLEDVGPRLGWLLSAVIEREALESYCLDSHPSFSCQEFGPVT